ncbi:MAG: hypothetical protein QOJ90_2237 [Actinomycetota bacterium]|nr:hypothetical protein [Actinomycetota bacterium]
MGPMWPSGRIRGMAAANDVHGEEVFRPRLAPMLAIAWYVVGALAAIDLVRRGSAHTIGVGLAVIALVTVVVYAIAARPAVVANANGVLLRNVLRDVWVPWHRVERIGARWSLTVEADGVEHGSWAIAASNPARQRERGRRIFGVGPIVMDDTSAPLDDTSGLVSAKLERLREKAADSAPDGTVDVRPAWGVLAAFGIALAALVIAVAV